MEDDVISAMISLSSDMNIFLTVDNSQMERKYEWWNPPYYAELELNNDMIDELILSAAMDLSMTESQNGRSRNDSIEIKESEKTS